MKYKTEKLEYKKIPLRKISIKSKEFYNLIKIEF